MRTTRSQLRDVENNYALRKHRPFRGENPVKFRMLQGFQGNSAILTINESFIIDCCKAGISSSSWTAKSLPIARVSQQMLISYVKDRS